MKPTDYGRVPVLIRKSNNGREAGNIALIYERPDHYSQETVICRLNTRTRYKHERMALSSVRNFYGYKRSANHLPYPEALVWLKKYCAYHRMDYTKFKIVANFSRSLTGTDEINMNR